VGTFAFTRNIPSVLLTENSAPVDDGFTNVGGIVDFVVSETGLNLDPGFRVVIPQLSPVPANAAYRKLDTANRTWSDFVQDGNNSVWSVQGSAGVCPSPGSDLWELGLNEGHWCVRLILEDGGPNDDDGRVNGSVSDPGGVAVQDTGNQAPVAVDDEITVSSNSTSTLDVLANDLDEDEDLLSITSASGVLSDVTFTDIEISYTPRLDFIGTDRITYAITDRQGGTALASATITVRENQAPVAVSDSVTIQSGLAVTISVLSNDTDPEGDALTVTEASAENGTISINENGSLRYFSDSGFSGTDTISYTIADALGDTSSTSVAVSVTAVPEPVARSSSGGGGGCSISTTDEKVDPLFYLMLIGALGYLLRRTRRGKLSA
jgi:hypothetical protein